MQNIMAQDSKISHLLAILASFNKDLADLAVGTFHVPSTVINQEPATFADALSMISPKSSLGIRANVISSVAAGPVTRRVSEEALE